MLASLGSIPIFEFTSSLAARIVPYSKEFATVYIWRTGARTGALLLLASIAKGQDINRNTKGLQIIEEAVPSFCQSASLTHTGDGYKLSTSAGLEVSGILKKLGAAHIDIGGEKTREITTGVLPEDIVAAIQAQSECAANVLAALTPFFLGDNPGPSPEDSIRQCNALAASPMDPGRPDNIPGVSLHDIDASPAETACRKAVEMEPTPRMQYQLGRALGQTHPSESHSYYKLAADRGYAAAQYNTGVDYEEGTGTHKDAAGAIKYYKLASDQGYMMATEALGDGYFVGKGVIPQSYHDALPFLKTAANAGDARSEYELGIMYLDGRGDLDISFSKARQLINEAAEQAYGAAFYTLGWMSEHGKGVEKSKDDAIYFYRKADKLGDHHAAHALDRLGVQ